MLNKAWLAPSLICSHLELITGYIFWNLKKTLIFEKK